MKTLRIIFIFVLLFVFNIINGQITIDGTITDSESNPISDALVEIIDQNDTSNYYSSVTNESGHFAVTNITDIRSKKTNLPSEFIVLRNYPNPFNPSTIIYYELPKAENIEIKIYDILGRKVRTLFNDFHKAGTYTLNWDGRNSWNSPVAAGIYFCRLKTINQFKVHKMVLLDGGSTSSSTNSPKVRKEKPQTITLSNSVFNYSIKITGNDILESEFQCLSCSGDTTLNLQVPKILQTAIIGAEGGKLETEEFLLIVPAGAFSEIAKIDFSVDPNDSLFHEYSGSSRFLLDGIPNNITENLLIGIKSENLNSDTLYSAIGQYGYNWGSGEEQYYFQFEPTFDSLGYYYCRITPQQITSVNSSDPLNKIIIRRPSSSISFELIKNFKFKFALQFYYWYPQEYENEINVFSLLMMDMYESFKNLGFTLETHEEWDLIGSRKAELYFTYMPPNDNFINPLRYESSLVEPNIIQINKDAFGNNILPEIRREVAHLYYYKYFFNEKFDPQLTFLQGGKKWLKNDLYLRVLHHSIAAWCEEIFNPISDDFVPHCFNKKEMQPFKGLFSWVNFNLIINDEYKHGFGLSALIKYLTNQYGKDILFNFYSHLAEKKLGADSFLDAIRESPTLASGNKVGENIWFPEFFKQYISGKIYSVQPEVFLLPTNLAGSIDFYDDDTLKYADKTYNDLSAKLFRININSEEIKNNKSLNFKLGPESLNLNYVKALVFGIRNSNLVFISEGIDFSLGNLYQFDGLLACVVNSGNEQPYTGTSEIQLDVRTKEELQFNACKIEINVIGVWERHRIPPPPNTSPTIDTMGYRAEWNTLGNFTANTFEGVLEKNEYGAEATGKVKIELDDQLNISSFSVEAKSHYDHENYQWDCAGIYIGLQNKTNWNMYFDAVGESTCNSLTKVYYYHESPPSITGVIPYSKLIDYYCDENSYIKVTFYKKSLP